VIRSIALNKVCELGLEFNSKYSFNHWLWII
jgi:hypothetical protein